MGVVTPVGNGLETFWSNLKNGVSGIRTIDALYHAYDCKIGGQVRDFDPNSSSKIQRTCGVLTALRIWQWPQQKWLSRTAGLMWPT